MAAHPGAGFQPDRLALTHGHGDHVLGAGALAGGEVFAHAATPAVIARHLAGWAERAGETRADGGAPAVWPTVTLTTSCASTWAAAPPRLPHARPQRGLVCVFLEAERTTVCRATPSSPGSCRRSATATAGAGGITGGLAGMEIEVLVAGHGPILRGREAARDWIEWLADYLAGRCARVRGARAGPWPRRRSSTPRFCATSWATGSPRSATGCPGATGTRWRRSSRRRGRDGPDGERRRDAAELRASSRVFQPVRDGDGGRGAARRLAGRRGPARASTRTACCACPST